ncbi:MAG TPA: hypothetical protein VF594_08545 [Rubricoccaceae bacterium]
MSSATAQDGVGVITVMNESDLTLYYLYASSCQEDAWGDDLLGSDVIAPGDHFEVPLNSGCWDLKAVAEDGQEVETYRVDLSAQDVVVWTVDEGN